MINEGMIRDIMERRAKEQEVAERLIENEQEYKDVINRIFTSEDGQVFYKYLLKFCRVYGHERTGNTVKMVEDNGRRAVFLEAVRPYLNRETRVKLEDIV